MQSAGYNNIQRKENEFPSYILSFASHDVQCERSFNMSGGSHDYICYRINDELCGRMEDKELNDLINDISILAHDLEWYHSGDIGRESYIKSINAFKKKWFKANRDERLRSYVDEAVAALKEEFYALIGASDND